MAKPKRRKFVAWRLSKDPFAVLRFKKFKKRRGNEKWKWILWGPQNAAGKRKIRASSRGYFTSRANALRNWKELWLDVRYAVIER